MSVYRIGKKAPGGRCALHELLYASTKMLKIQCFLSLYALVGYQCMASIFNCMQLYAAHSVSHIVFLCDACVCQFDTSNKIDIEQSIYYLREKVKKFSRKHLTRAKHVLY